MKKLFFSAIAAVAAFAMVSCNGTPSANLKTDVDTLSYALGMSQTQGMKQALAQQMGVDTAYIDQFLKGVADGANAGDDKSKAAYFAGLQVGQSFRANMVKGVNYELFGEDTTQTVSLKNILAGFNDGAKGKTSKFTPEQAMEYVQKTMSVVKAKNMEKQYGEYKKQNEKFLADNKKKEGVVTLPSGVQYKVIKEGTGATPADTSVVKVNYEGKLIDGTVFDSSYQRGEPVDFRANQVIKGWTEALTHMKAGSTYEVYIPQELAYAERSQGQIKPFSTLVFKIELIEVK